MSFPDLREGPHAPQRERFLLHLLAEGFAAETLRQVNSQIHLAATMLNLSEGRTFGPRDLVRLRKRWLSNPPRARFRKHPLKRAVAMFVSRAKQWLTFLGLWNDSPVKEPFDELLGQFIAFGRLERGLAEATLFQQRRDISMFLTWCGAHARGKLNQLHPKDLSAYVNHGPLSRWSRRTIASHISYLRVFLRWASERRLCSANLPNSLGAPRIYTHERYPIGPTWDEVQALVSSTQGTEPSDIRDRAVLLLLSVYGFRAGEIAALRLEDIDWQREIIRPPRPKQRRAGVYPLTHEVGNAIIAYLRQVRPKCARRQLFLAMPPPYRALTAAAIGVMVRRRQKTIGQQLRRFGPHAIRHACATHLLAEGYTLKQIGDYLGHSMVRATEAYAKVDLSALRQVGEMSLTELIDCEAACALKETPFHPVGSINGLRLVADLTIQEVL